MKKLLFLLLLLPFIVNGQLTRAQVDAEADVIKSETQAGKNTALRVGTNLRHIIDNTKWSNEDEWLVVAGNSNYTATPSPTIASYYQGLKVTVLFVNAATGASTLALLPLGAQPIINPDGTIVDGTDITQNSIHTLVYDGSSFQLQGGGSSVGTDVFASNVTFNLTGGKTFGKYTNGQTAAWTGLTAIQAIEDASVEYVNPVFTGFSVDVAATLEVGSSISSTHTAAWSINVGSGTVPTLDIYDNTDALTLVSNTPNDGSQAFTATTIQLNSNGATQSWKGIGHNTSPAGNFNSNNYVVTARYYRWCDPVSSSLTNSASVRALTTTAFYTGASVFILNTGTSLTKFVTALPPGVNIVSVVDLDALGVDITAQYILKTNINVLDAGSTNRSYNINEMNVGSPYSVNHRHQITTN